MLLDKLLTHRLQVVAGIEPFGNLSDVLAERFAIAEIG